MVEVIRIPIGVGVVVAEDSAFKGDEFQCARFNYVGPFTPEARRVYLTGSTRVAKVKSVTVVKGKRLVKTEDVEVPSVLTAHVLPFPNQAAARNWLYRLKRRTKLHTVKVMR